MHLEHTYLWLLVLWRWKLFCVSVLKKPVLVWIIYEVDIIAHMKIVLVLEMSNTSVEIL